MAVTVERADAREWSDEQLENLFSDGFPPFITADRVAKQYIGRVREWFSEWDLILVDAEQNDGTALDPWIRTHLRLGASILAAAPASQTMTGTVAEWEQWYGSSGPASHCRPAAITSSRRG
jgi:hypothetical protein